MHGFGDIAILLNFGNLVWKCLLTPLLGGFWGTFPQNDVTRRSSPKRTVLGLNHVIWAVKREYMPRGSSWALDREKKDSRLRGRKKVKKSYISPTCIWRESPTDTVAIYIKLFCRWHLGRVPSFKMKFYRRSSFLFSYWFLNGFYNSAARLLCLWYSLKVRLHDTTGCHKPVWQPVEYLCTRYNLLSNRLSNRFLTPGLTTGLTTGCIV